MVYTVTLNPAVDYVVQVDRLAPGEVNRAKRAFVQFGGKGVNVSVVLRRLGVESTALGFIAGFTGDALEQDLRAQGVQTDFVRLRQGMTRINVKLKAGEETEINAGGPPIGPDAQKALFEKLDALRAGDVLVLAGSVPAGLAPDTYAQMLRRLDGRGVLAVWPTPSRRCCAARWPAGRSSSSPTTSSWEPSSAARCARRRTSPRARRSCTRAAARNVLVSMAGDGALLLDETGACRRAPAPAGRVKNSVGAGDSMVAGFLAGWLQTGDFAYALRLGTAAGSAAAFSDGLPARADIEALLAQTRAGAIKNAAQSAVSTIAPVNMI